MPVVVILKNEVPIVNPAIQSAPDGPVLLSGDQQTGSPGEDVVLLSGDQQTGSPGEDVELASVRI